MFKKIEDTRLYNMSNNEDDIFEMELNSEDGNYTSNETLNSFILLGDIEDGEFNSDTTGVFDKEGESENDKENLKQNRFLSTKEQLEQLDASMMDDCNDDNADATADETTDKNCKWNELANELNRLGPARPAEKWKKIWASRKYNIKKRVSRRHLQGFMFQPALPKSSNNDKGGGLQTPIQENNCCAQTSKVLPLILQEMRRTNYLLQKLLEK